MKSLFIIPLILVFLVGLTSCKTQQEHESNMSSWLGASESALVDAWGTPTSFYETDDKKYLTWKNSSQALVGGYAPVVTYDYYGNAYSGGGMPPILVNSNCDITMIIKDGVVNEWRSEGNNCYDF